MLHAAIHWPDLADSTLWPMAVPHATFFNNHVPDLVSGLSPIGLLVLQDQVGATQVLGPWQRQEEEGRQRQQRPRGCATGSTGRCNRSGWDVSHLRVYATMLVLHQGFSCPVFSTT